jgi:hypothetical protein
MGEPTLRYELAFDNGEYPFLAALAGIARKNHQFVFVVAN